MNLKLLPAFLLLLLFPAVAAGQSRKVTRPVSNYPADVQVGEAELEVRRSQLVHRVAVAPNGVVAVEFPADDAVVSEHPGNRDLVTLDGADEAETPATRRRATDPLIFRPGPGFTVAKSGKPLTAYGVQFGSGLYVTFLFYPVADLSRNAHRLILKYDLAEIAAARAAAGLRTNLVAPPKPRIVAEAERLRRAEAAAAEEKPKTIPAAGNAAADSPTGEAKPAPTSEKTTDAATQTAAPSSEEPPRTISAPASGATASPADEAKPAPAAEKKTDAATQTKAGTSEEKPTMTPGAPPSPASEKTTDSAPANGAAASSEKKTDAAADNVRPTDAAAPDAPVRRAKAAPAEEKPQASPTRKVNPERASEKDDEDADRLRRLATERIADLERTSAALNFGKPRYGLSLAVAENADLDAQFRIVVIAVKNRLAAPLRLTPGQPELFIETLQKGRPVLSERLIPAAVVSSLPADRFLPPDEIRWFALVYPAPILGVSQTLKVGVSQTNAADAPAAAEITVKGR
jgi:hypothetical protein